jgi:glucose-6-phosphate 1-dehydrogenase
MAAPAANIATVATALGDAMPFVREDAVEAAWSIVEPIQTNATTLHPYEPGSWGPREADRLAIEVGGWHDPEERNESAALAPTPA